ncbi:Gfo/Idh/MocA family protein [Roseomonas marmotae]|uniref:Gfo/Idh/MocA family oxidoreductase n=1 Tax=Roseomonas marmotae TaxID=2768161 RepID=A0ABS3K823_9PROT|nr:Gfo/Idh/MocA family oxidoreductase [Roseomonas marmotae]MBO1073612.1 Gfo/Idh/MocA family oxidoreductase [Roseomonas marmotae]QTI80207.1 Gfo/Idh/MocA family oxidoreductase [Roseomonas marmotae]
MAALALGIIGFGIMGERLLRQALPHPAFRLSGIWDPSPAAAARLAAADPELRMAADAEAVIAGCDTLYVAAPPAAHIPLARAALKAGKAVLLEKPLATDPVEAAAFVAEAEAMGARAAVNFPMASSPAVAQLRAWREEIGAPQRLEIETHFARWPRGWQQDAASWLSRRAEGGFTREVVSHFLFLTRRQLGPLELISAKPEYPAGDLAETGIAAELTAGGIPLRLTGSVGRIAEDEANAWTLTAARGAIRLRNWSLAERLGDDGQWHMAPDAIPNERMRPMTLRGQMDKLAAMTRGEPHALATLREALEVQTVVEAMLAG